MHRHRSSGAPARMGQIGRTCRPVATPRAQSASADRAPQRRRWPAARRWSARLGPLGPLSRARQPGGRARPRCRRARRPGHSPPPTRASSPASPAASSPRAIAEYERIEETLGRLVSYAQLLFAGDSTDAAIGRFYQRRQRAGDDDQQPPAVLHAGTEPAGRRGAGGEARRPGAGALPALAARPARLPPAPALRRAGEAAAREGGHRARRPGAGCSTRPWPACASPVRRRGADRQRRAEQAVRPRPQRRARRRRDAIGEAFGAQRQAVRADHQHARQGQGDHRHVAPLPAPRQLPQPRQHGRGRGGGRARLRRHAPTIRGCRIAITC